MKKRIFGSILLISIFIISVSYTPVTGATNEVELELNDINDDKISTIYNITLNSDSPNTRTATADINGDGIKEIYMFKEVNGGTMYLLNSSDGSVIWDTLVDFSYELISADHGALDGVPDLISTSSSEARTTVLNGSDGSTILNGTWTTIGNPIGGLVYADMDEDGVPEVLSAKTFDGLHYIDSALSWDWYFNPVNSITTKPVAADIDNNGFKEIIVGVEKNVIVLSSGGHLMHNISLGIQTEEIYTLDYDQNGQLEILVQTNNEYFLLNLDGEIIERMTASVSSAYPGIADLNHDGYLDLYYTNFFDELVAYDLYHGEIIFSINAEPVNIIGSDTRAVDLDGDGDLDLLAEYNSVITGINGQTGEIIFQKTFQHDTAGIQVDNFDSDPELEIFAVRNNGYFLLDLEDMGTEAYWNQGDAPTWSNNNNIREIDSDSDTILDSKETELGTNPNLADTDGDGINDGVEIKVTNSDPLVANDHNDNQETVTEEITTTEVITTTATSNDTTTNEVAVEDESFLPVPFWILPVSLIVLIIGRRRS